MFTESEEDSENLWKSSEKRRRQNGLQDAETAGNCWMYIVLGWLPDRSYLWIKYWQIIRDFCLRKISKILPGSLRNIKCCSPMQATQNIEFRLEMYTEGFVVFRRSEISIQCKGNKRVANTVYRVIAYIDETNDWKKNKTNKQKWNWDTGKFQVEMKFLRTFSASFPLFLNIPIHLSRMVY